MSASSQLPQLHSARELALGDGRYYPTIIPGVLPIIAPSAGATLEVQRWGADFLAETFASPTWPLDAKAPIALKVLPTLKEYLETEDTTIVKSAVQAAACIYPLVYRHTYVTPRCFCSLASYAERSRAECSHPPHTLPVV
jgi:symplekin